MKNTFFFDIYPGSVLEMVTKSLQGSKTHSFSLRRIIKPNDKPISKRMSKFTKIFRVALKPLIGNHRRTKVCGLIGTQVFGLIMTSL